MSGRAALRLSRAAAPLFSSTASPAVRAFPAFQRTFAKTAFRAKSDVVRETEVPVSNYSADAKGSGASDHYSIPVNREAAQPTPFPSPEDADVVPLTREVYDTMPPMMQKMTVMDKVVIVTG